MVQIIARNAHLPPAKNTYTHIRVKSESESNSAEALTRLILIMDYTEKKTQKLTILEAKKALQVMRCGEAHLAFEANE